MADELCAVLIEADEIIFADLMAGHAPAPYGLPESNLESPEVLAMLQALATKIRPDFAPAAWLIVEGGDAVGLCSVIKLPGAGILEIGYGIAEGHRNRGAAGRAIADLLTWARTDPRVGALRAETSTGNVASQRVLERNGFVATGTRTDPEDGELIRWEIHLGT